MIPLATPEGLEPPTLGSEVLRSRALGRNINRLRWCPMLSSDPMFNSWDEKPEITPFASRRFKRFN